MLFNIKTDEHFTLKKGDDTLNVDELGGELNNRLKYVLLTQTEYDSLTTKDSGTLYLIGGTKYTITLTGSSVNEIYDITVNGESKTTSDFPMEVDEDSSLEFKCGTTTTGTVTMGGVDITSSVRTEQSTGSGVTIIVYYAYDISNITGDIVVEIVSSHGGGGNE